jgi:hypothetical protein
MKIEAEIPEGFHIMAMESSVTNKGATHYRVWMRSSPHGEFRGGEGFTLQEAIDASMTNLREAMRSTVKPTAFERIAGSALNLKLNLSALHLKGD